MIKERPFFPGLHFNNAGLAHMRCWAPFARGLDVVTIDNRRFLLEQDSGGWWQGFCPGLLPGTRYFLEIKGKGRFPDPASLSQPDGVHGASEALDLESILGFKRKDWQGVPMEDQIIYELHTGTFSPSGTFEGIINKLPYLKDLGINAIELMPVASFPGKRNWGYDGVFPYAVQHSYGGAKGLAALVNACHSGGIAVILDVVYNHLGPEGNILGAFGPYFTRRYPNPWGRAMNFDGRGRAGVRSYFLENALMWMRDFDIDGLRLDAIHTIIDQGPRHFLLELSEAVKQLNVSTGRTHFLIAESDLNDTMILEPPEAGGLGLEAQWCDDWHHALHAFLTGEQRGYYADFGSLSHLAKSFRGGFVYDGVFSRYRKKLHGKPSTVSSGKKFVVYAQNHDQVGNRAMGERLTALVDFEVLKLAAGAVLFSPFLPMLFMGEEYGEDSPFLYFTSHGNERLAARVRAGRRREFSSFMKKGNPPDPQSEETFLRSRLKWDFKDFQQKKLLLRFYKECIRLRKEHSLFGPALFKDLNILIIQKDKGLLVKKTRGQKKTLVIFNFSGQPLFIKIHEPKRFSATLVLYSAHKSWGGSMDDDYNPLLHEAGEKLKVKMLPKSFAVIFQSPRKNS